MSDLDIGNAHAAIQTNDARRCGVAGMIPTIGDYAKNGPSWRRRIAKYHGVSESMAKKLVNRVLNFGSYHAWLKEHRLGETSAPDEPGVLKLIAEVTAFRNHIFAHPEFKSRIDAERRELQRKRPKDAPHRIERSLWSYWLQEREHGILMLIDERLRWMFGNGAVRVLIFDGCLVLVPEGTDLPAKLSEVEKWLREVHDWDVELNEKPLHGKQDEPVESIRRAREALREYEAYVNGANVDDVDDHGVGADDGGGREGPLHQARAAEEPRERQLHASLNETPVAAHATTRDVVVEQLAPTSAPSEAVPPGSATLSSPPDASPPMEKNPQATTRPTQAVHGKRLADSFAPDGRLTDSCRLRLMEQAKKSRRR